MLIEALFTTVLSAVAPQAPSIDQAAPIVLCDEHGKTDEKKQETSGKKKEGDKKGNDPKPEEPKPS
jgi:hypothetical protein